YIAEGSDGGWWYGDEHRGAYNEEFDRIYRQHLSAVFRLLGLDTPLEYFTPVYHRVIAARAVLPDMLLTPTIDGRLTHFYEWAGAGVCECSVAGRAMHHTQRNMAQICFAYDRDRLYIRVDFARRSQVDMLKEPCVRLTFHTPQQKAVDLPLVSGRRRVESPEYEYAYEEILEVAVSRDSLWPEGHGQVAFSVTLMDGDRPLQTGPEGDPISLRVFERNQELFWP
ncbi:MAG: hypothetical protein AB1744_12905, partial [Candidatus Zixiibacteriota bacterium]